MTTSDPCRLAELRTVLPHADACAPEVSAWTVGEHVAHCALAATQIAQAVLASEAPPPGGPTLMGRLVLLTGFIPRGRAKAPAQVVPSGTPSADALRAALDEAEDAVARLAGAPRDGWFRHFALGVLARDRALRFLAIHDGHHLKIVRDVLRRAR